MKKENNVDVHNYTSNIFASSKKMRPVLDLVRGQTVYRAINILQNCSKRKFADIIIKSINAAVANGVNNMKIQRDNLYLTVAYATKGRTIKRMFPKAKGVSNARYKHVCNLYVGLKNMEGN